MTTSWHANNRPLIQSKCNRWGIQPDQFVPVTATATAAVVVVVVGLCLGPLFVLADLFAK